jgi:hypothetical protein
MCLSTLKAYQQTYTMKTRPIKPTINIKAAESVCERELNLIKNFQAKTDDAEIEDLYYLNYIKPVSLQHSSLARRHHERRTTTPMCPVVTTVSL